ncbi:MAG: GyrI-like domain-containing protein [Eubacteriales bacterium]|nr:GyrI-like domain-containing protein [Eubacteriales bacterium]
MAQITKVYRQALPAMKLVGKCYGDADKVNDTFAGVWSTWFENGLFAPLEQSDRALPIQDGDAYIGLLRCKAGEPIQYWVGMFMAPDAQVPQGYDSVPLAAGEVVVCWVYGREPDIYMADCLPCIKEEGAAWAADQNGVLWCFERYACPRFTSPDEKGTCAFTSTQCRANKTLCYAQTNQKRPPLLKRRPFN